jgi:hypothetical protein
VQARSSWAPAPVFPRRENTNQVTVTREHTHRGQGTHPVAAHHMQDHVHGRGELALQCVAGHTTQRGQRLQPSRHLGGGVRVERSGPTLVAGVERGEQLAHFRPPYLSDHQAIRPHPQRLAHQVT